MKPKQKKSTFPASLRLVAAALIGLLLVGGGTLLARYAVWHTRQSTVAELARLLRSDRPEVREAAAKQLKGRGAEGVAPLVQAMLDERQSVFALACDTIDRSIAEWQFLAPDEATERRVALADQLQQVIEALPAERRFAPRRWAERIAVERTPHRLDDPSKVLAQCEAVLRKSPVQTTVELPAQATRAADAARRMQPRAAVDLSVTEPNAYQEVSNPQPPTAETSIAQPDLPLVPRTEPETPPQAPQRLVTPEAKPLAPRQLTLTRSPPRSPQKPAEEPFNLQQRADVEIMHRLHEADVDLAREAETELQRRGYRAIDLPLCRALTHPDPAVRRELVEALPAIQGINARPWLMQLAEDPDADVRQAAEGILSTSGNRSSSGKLR